MGRPPESGGEVARGSDASDAPFREFLADIDLGALMLDASGTIRFINDYLLRVLGRTREELIDRPWIDTVIPPDERPELRAVFEAAIASGTLAGHREDSIVTRSGTIRRLRWSSVVQRDSDGVVLGLASIAFDVTDARRAEAERTLLAAAIEQSTESPTRPLGSPTSTGHSRRCPATRAAKRLARTPAS